MALELGPQGIADEMLYQRYDLGEIMNTDPYEVPPGMKMDTREYKRNVAKDARSFTSTKAIIDRQFAAFQAQMQSDNQVEEYPQRASRPLGGRRQGALESARRSGPGETPKPQIR